MKNIQLINPKQAAELLRKYQDSFIQVLTNDKPIVLARSNSFNEEQLMGVSQIKNYIVLKLISLIFYPCNIKIIQ
jgi:hypothetical protein